MKLTLTRVIRKDTDKEGNPLKTKDGRTYTRLAIQAQEYGQKWISGFASNWNEFWKEGMSVDAEVTENGEYLNLEKPDPMAALAEQINKLGNTLATLKDIPARVKALEDFMKNGGIRITDTVSTESFPKEEDLPF